MKLRQAKKIIEGFNPNWIKKFLKLRPPQRNGNVTIWPSHDDIDIVMRARKVYLRHVKRGQMKITQIDIENVERNKK